MQLFAFFLAFVALAAGQYIVLNEFAGYTTTDCSTTNTGADVYPVNRCLVSSAGSSSIYYNYSSSNTSQIIATQYYSSTDCTTNTYAYVFTYVLGQCSGGKLPSYSATLPALSGSVSITDSAETCPGSDPIGYSYTYFDVCISFTKSVKYSYYGGGSCVVQIYNTSDCTGPLEVGTSVSPDCDEGHSTACAVNGKFLPAQVVKQSVTAGSQYQAIRYYASADCTSTAAATSYYAASGCNGKGALYTLSGAGLVTLTFFDNANCTGHNIYSQVLNSDDNYINFGKCDSELDRDDKTNHSTKGSLEAFPSGAAVTIGSITSDSCTNPTQTFAAVVYNGACIRANATASARVSCTVNGANTTINTTIYATPDCTGAPFHQDGDSELTCSENFDYKGVSEGTYTKYYCNSVLPGTTTSDAAPSVKPVASSSVLFAVVVAMVLAVYVV